VTNSLAIFLALVVAGAFALDYFLWDTANTVYLGRKFLELITWIAFWR